MEELKRDVAELKELVSKLLAIKLKEYEGRYNVPHDGLVKKDGKLVHVNVKSNSS